MQDQWYGDKRDLIKWSVLIHLAEKIEADKILQIAYFRQTKFGRIKIDTELVEVHPEVKSHFRDIRNIKSINSRVTVDVFDREFVNRSIYHDSVIEFIKSFSGLRCIIFLDPDTGLQPQNRPDHKHVLEEEVKQVWLNLKANDLLVFYQHQTNRSNEPWIEPKREQLAWSLGIATDSVKIASAPEIINDVVFFYCQKDDSLNAELTNGL